MKPGDRVKLNSWQEFQTISKIENGKIYWVGYHDSINNPVDLDWILEEKQMTTNEQIIELLKKQTYSERLEFASDLLSALDDYHNIYYFELTRFSLDDIAQVLNDV